MGSLELWDADVTQAVQRIKPAFNRCVIFQNNSRVDAWTSDAA